MLGLFRRSTNRNKFKQLSSRAFRRWWFIIIPSSLFDAKLLAICYGFNGTWSNDGGLSSQVYAIYDRSRFYGKQRPKGFCFLGDGEMDEPEATGALTLASRENLDDLIFVVNCNLQRLDGPVRGNSKVVQELEGAFRGAGWNVIKVVWGSDWDVLFEKDVSGLLLRRIEEVVDGELLKYVVEGGAYIRENFFGKYPELLKLVEHLSDEDIEKLRLGGHDPVKVYSAFSEAVNHKGSPTVILARTIKGYGLGEAGEGEI